MGRRTRWEERKRKNKGMEYYDKSKQHHEVMNVTSQKTVMINKKKLKIIKMNQQSYTSYCKGMAVKNIIRITKITYIQTYIT